MKQSQESIAFLYLRCRDSIEFVRVNNINKFLTQFVESTALPSKKNKPSRLNTLNILG
jgi:hypothetical protein